MKLSAVILGRVLLFVESFDLNPRGKAYYPDIVRRLVEHCGFIKFPQKIEDFDEHKGVEFSGGKWGDVTIEMLKIFQNGLQLDTRVSTTTSETVLDEALAWASKELGIVYSPNMVSRKGYVSDLTFYTDVPILSAYSPVSSLMERAHRKFEQMTGDNAIWQPTVLTIHSDMLPRKPLHAPFTIQRRAETAFSENKYFSEAPFPTDVHIQLLEQFEADVLAALHGSR
jgi:hypothetical protein